jgi:AraC family transcriptional regulator of arabinose operon
MEPAPHYHALEDSSQLLCGMMSFPPGTQSLEFQGGEQVWNFSYTLSGSVRDILPQGEAMHRPHDFMVYKPGFSHRWEVPREASDPWNVVWFLLKPKPEWIPILDLPEELRFFSRVSLAGQKYQRRIRRSLVDAFWLVKNMKDGNALAINALERAVLWLAADRRDIRGPRDERVRATMELFSKRLANPPSIAEAATACGLSSSRLTGLFLAAVGKTPQQWSEELRLTHARQLLLSTGLPIKLIADAVGYDDQRYFATRFRKFFGSTPGGYREEQA